MMNIGLMKWFDKERGYGVIISVPDTEYFIHKNEFTIIPEKILVGTAIVFELKHGRVRLEGTKGHPPSSYEDWVLIMDLLDKPDTVSLEVEVIVRKRFGNPYHKKETKSYSVKSSAAHQLLRNKSKEEIVSIVGNYYKNIIAKQRPDLFYKYATFIKGKIEDIILTDGDVLKEIFIVFNQHKNNNILFQAWVNGNPGILNYTTFPQEELTTTFFKENVRCIKQEHLSKIQILTNADEVLFEICSFNAELYLENKTLEQYIFLAKIIDSISSENLKTECNLKLAAPLSLIPQITDDKMLHEFSMRFPTNEICTSIINKWYHQNNSLTISLLKRLVEVEYPLNEIQQNFFTRFSESATISELKSLLALYPNPNVISKLIEKIDFIKEDPIAHLKIITDFSNYKSLLEGKIINLFEETKSSFSYFKLKRVSLIIGHFAKDFFSLNFLNLIESLSEAEFLNTLKKTSGGKNLSSSYDLSRAVEVLGESMACLFTNELIQEQKKTFEEFIIHNSSASVIIEAWEQDLIPTFISNLITKSTSFSTDNLFTIFETGKLDATLMHQIISSKSMERENDEWVLKASFKFLNLKAFQEFDNIVFQQSENGAYFNYWKKGIGKVFPAKYIKHLIIENSSEIYEVVNQISFSQNHTILETSTEVWHVYEWVKEKLCTIDEVANIYLQLLDENPDVIDRQSFYLKFRCIKYLVRLDIRYNEEILKRQDDFNSLILWFLELHEEFDLKLLQRKFIYFSPSDQVKIIKRLFYLKHQDKVHFTIVELEEIVRADLDLFLLNEKFNNDFVLDISTSLIIELIKNYQSQGRFLADSDLLKIVLHDIGKKRRKKFKIEGYFENCEGRSEAKWNWNNTRGKVFKTTNGNDYYFIIEFDYDSNLVNAVKNIPGRKFDSNSKNWTAPSSSEQAVISFIRTYRFFYDAGSNNFSNNPHLAVFERKEIPNGIKFCEGRIANKKDARLDKAFWWCAGQPCLQHCETEHLTLESDYNKLTLLDLLKIFKINVDENNSYGFIPNGKYYQLISQINRFNRLLERLYCQGCDEILFPVESSNFAAYTVVRFSCNNSSCAEHGKTVYLNHCLDGKCNYIIDSRISKKCDNGLYICNGCGGCCSHDMLNRRLNNLRTNGGVIHQQLIEAVEGKKGHQEKNEYFCYKCTGIMTEVIDDINGKPNYFMCLECKVEYHPTSILTRPHMHLRRQNYPTSKLSEILRNGNNPSSSGGFDDFDF